MNAAANRYGMLKRIRDSAGVVLGFRLHDASRWSRTRCIAAMLLIVFWIPFGGVIEPPLIASLGDVGISPDGLFRAVPVSNTDSRPTIPVTIVDIDETTWNAWGSPKITPRERLAAMVDRIVRAGAVAVVPDIDLSGDTQLGREDGDAFRAFLNGYAASAAPILLPKRIDETTGRPAASSYDGLVGFGDPAISARPRPNLVWIDATLESDDDGVIRHWPLWREVCVGEGTLMLPSVVTGVLATVQDLALMHEHDVQRPVPTGRCRDAETPTSSPRLLVRRGASRLHLTGTGTTVMAGPVGNSLIALPAHLMGDGDARLDDATLFGGRVVFIGASHVASRDFHRTVYGDLPGVEIWAQQLHLAPLQDLGPEGRGIVFNLAVSVLFMLLLAIDFFLRRLKMLSHLLLLMLAAWVGVQLLRFLSTYEVIVTAVLLLVALIGLRSVGEMFEDWTRLRKGHPELSFAAALRKYLFLARPWMNGED